MFSVSVFQNSSDPDLRRIFDNIIYPARKSAPKIAREGLTRICERKRYAFFTSVPIYQIIRRDLPCVVVEVPKAYFSKVVSLVMRKGLPFKWLLFHK
jgi:hypothetical protein